MDYFGPWGLDGPDQNPTRRPRSRTQSDAPRPARVTFGSRETEGTLWNDVSTSDSVPVHGNDEVGVAGPVTDMYHHKSFVSGSNMFSECQWRQTHGLTSSSDAV